MVSLLGLEVKDLEALLGPTEPRYRARQLYSAIYRERRPDLQTATNLPSQLRDRLTSTHKLGLPGIERRYDSADGTRRYLLSLEDGRSAVTDRYGTFSLEAGEGSHDITVTMPGYLSTTSTVVLFPGQSASLGTVALANDTSGDLFWAVVDVMVAVSLLAVLLFICRRR
jgi:hypothetical protein